MIRYLLIFSMFFVSCSGDKKDKRTENKNDNIIVATSKDSVKTETAIIEPIEFEVAKVDSVEKRIQRIFAVIDSTRAHDTTLIRKIICELKNNYPLDNESSVSFFCDKKYANYKTDLFVDPGHTLPPDEMENWMDRYYVGEYSLRTKQYSAFPFSAFIKRQKVYIIKACSKP